MSNQITPNPQKPSQVVAGLHFPKFVSTFGNIPTSYKDSMTYYETLVWFCRFLEETVIPTLNENGKAVEELQALYIELNSYVDNYFKNLDVQEEINNKLDSMVESGTLQEIIAEYLNSKAVFGFDTVEDMVTATNLINGSYAKTYGYYDKNDEGGASYFITNVSNEDEFQIELNNGLYATLEINNKLDIKKIGCKCDFETYEDGKLAKAIDYCKNNNKVLLLTGYVKIKEPLNIKGVQIEGANNNIPSGRETRAYTSKKYGYIQFDYLKNTGNGALITFKDFCEDILEKGQGIISDTASPIIYTTSDYKNFNLKDICIVGWLRTTNQIGIEHQITNANLTYINGQHLFNNVHVFNCSGNGIVLHSLELTTFEKVNACGNFGNGLIIEGDLTKDSPVDYVKFDNCNFSNNKLNGIYLKDCFRKNVEFENTMFNSNGLYHELGISPENNTKDLKAGIKIYGNNPYNEDDTKGLSFIKCYGEECEKLIHIESNGETTNNITSSIYIRNCFNLKYSSNNSTTLYLDVEYCKDFSMFEINSNVNNYLVIGDKTNNIQTNIIGSNAIYNTLQSKILPTITVNENLNITKNEIKRVEDTIYLDIEGTASTTIPAWQNLVNNLPKPLGNLSFTCFIDNNPKMATLYTTRNISSPSAINQGEKLVITLFYNTLHLADKNGN